MGRKKHRKQQRTPLPRALFFDEAADRERSCARKDAYETQAHARAHAAMNGVAAALSVYECRYCGMFHLTSRRETSPGESM